MIAPAARQVRKVRASQGRMPDNVRWRRLQGQCNRNIPPVHSRVKGYMYVYRQLSVEWKNRFCRFFRAYAGIRSGKGGKAV